MQCLFRGASSINVVALLPENSGSSCSLGQASPFSEMPFGQGSPPQGLSANLVLVGSLRRCCELTGQVLEIAQTRQAE